jgi:hypothetical protein
MGTSLNIETERLYMRPVTVEDAEAIYNYRSDPIVNRYQGFIPSTVLEVQDFSSIVFPRRSMFPARGFSLLYSKRQVAGLMAMWAFIFSILVAASVRLDIRSVAINREGVMPPRPFRPLYPICSRNSINDEYLPRWTHVTSGQFDLLNV